MLRYFRLTTLVLEIALSTTETEYTGLSYCLREAIPIMDLPKEMKQKGLCVNSEKA